MTTMVLELELEKVYIAPNRQWPVYLPVDLVCFESAGGLPRDRGKDVSRYQVP
jgi:hypothetical protein